MEATRMGRVVAIFATGKEEISLMEVVGARADRTGAWRVRPRETEAARDATARPREYILKEKKNLSGKEGTTRQREREGEKELKNFSFSFSFFFFFFLFLFSFIFLFLFLFFFLCSLFFVLCSSLITAGIQVALREKVKNKSYFEENEEESRQVL